MPPNTVAACVAYFWRGKDKPTFWVYISRMTHRRASHKRASLTGLHLIGVHLRRASLTGVHLTGVHLIDVHLSDVHLIGVHPRRASLTGVYLIGVHCEGCQEFIQLSGAYMTKTNKLNKPEKGAIGLGSCGVASGVA
jgi:uncharacterized protein YjbI with pentapeptide repeats